MCLQVNQVRMSRRFDHTCNSVKNCVLVNVIYASDFGITTYSNVRRVFEKNKNQNRQEKNRVNRFFTMRSNLQLKARMMLYS